ncbi:MAG: DUF5979 domain-containing protein [Oscillospiraceae bacterium]|nr:DUF5979 domain-containing protein [Oscillospiraceae bacterium]
MERQKNKIRKPLAAGLALAFVLTAAFTTPGLFRSVSATDVTVGNITELMDALSAADDSDTITLSPSTFTLSSGGAYVLSTAAQNVTIVGRFIVRNTTVASTTSLTINSETLTIDANNTGSVITVEDGGILIMNGGTITNGNAREGGGVRIIGGEFTMNAGVISGNIATRSGGDGGNGGGVCIGENEDGHYGGTFDMWGGIISDNTASGGNGGGVYVNEFPVSTFNMHGGTISNNTATRSGSNGGDGGGISVSFNGIATIHRGYFYNNAADQHGGAIGTGWEDGVGKTTVNNPVIAYNQAQEGGGIYGCPEGTVVNIENNYTAIFQNKALKMSDPDSGTPRYAHDVFIEKPDTGANSFVVPAYMLNGEPYVWLGAGTVVDEFLGTQPYLITGVANPSYSSSRTESEILGIIALLEAEFPAGSVFIVNNIAGVTKSDGAGGGIGGNGSFVVIGKEVPPPPAGTGNLTLKKITAGTGPHTTSFEFTVTFSAAVSPGPTGFTSADSGITWTGDLNGGDIVTFTGIPTGTDYTISETLPTNYTLDWNIPAGANIELDGTVTGTAEANKELSFIAKNTKDDTPPPDTGSLKITKAVLDENGDPVTGAWDPGEEFKFTVTFTGSFDFSGVLLDGSAFSNGDPVTLNDAKRAATFTNIPAGAGYEIVETDDAGLICVSHEDPYGEAEGTVVKDVMIEEDFENQRLAPGTAVIKGTKSVIGAGAPSGTQLTFTLTQVENEEGAEWTGGPPITDEKHVTTNATGPKDYEFFFEIEGLTEAGSPYFFKIKETKGGGGSYWSNDVKERIVKVEVEDDDEPPVYEWLGDAGPIFKNTYTYRPPVIVGDDDDDPPPTDPPGDDDDDDDDDDDEDPEPTPPPSPPPRPLPPSDPGNTLIPNDDGTFTEIDENGVPLTVWRWDPELEEWIPEDPPPLAYMPATGDINMIPQLVMLLAISVLGFGISLRRRRSDK